MSLTSVFASDDIVETPTSIDLINPDIVIYAQESGVIMDSYSESNLASNQDMIEVINQSSIINNNYSSNNISGFSGIPINLASNNQFMLKMSDGLNITNTKSSNIIYIAEDATNEDIQKIIDSAEKNVNIEFLGKLYNNIALTVTNNPVTIVSNCGTTLNGINSKPIISITGNSIEGTQIMGLNLIGGSLGIGVNGAKNIKITDNSISSCQNGIICDSVVNINIENNRITNINNNAISFKNVQNSNIIENILKDNTNGIYYDKGNQNTNINKNTITGSYQYGLNLDQSGSNLNIQGNLINNNQNGIFVNCNADNLNIVYNTIDSNKENGINIGANYRKDSEGIDFTLLGNVITNNANYNILAKDSIYSVINLAGNWMGTDNPSFIKVDSKIKLPFYSLKVKQISSKSFKISIGPNGIANPLLPTTTVSVSFDGGKTWVAVSVVNGQALVYVTKGDGKVVIRDYGPDMTFTLKNFVPYIPSIKPYDYVVSNSPTNNETQKNQINGTQIDGSSNSKGNSQDPTEDVVVVGTGAIIVLLLLIIAAYYRKDIEEMLNRKKGQ